MEKMLLGGTRSPESDFVQAAYTLRQSSSESASGFSQRTCRSRRFAFAIAERMMMCVSSRVQIKTPSTPVSPSPSSSVATPFDDDDDDAPLL